MITQTVLLLAQAVQSRYLDLSLVVEEFTWLMINVVHLCSLEQINQLRSVVEILVNDCLTSHPSHVVQALINYLSQLPALFEEVLPVFDRLVLLQEKSEAQSAYGTEDVINNFRLHSFCKLASTR